MERFCFTDYPSNYGRVPEQFFGPQFGGNGLMSMDNPEYILNEQQRQRNSVNGRIPSGNGSVNNHGAGAGNYHTLGIPFVNSGSPNAQGPPSVHSAPGGGGVPFNSLSSTSSGTVASSTNHGGPLNGKHPFSRHNPPGLPRTPGSAGSNPHPSTGEESDEHEYINDFDRLQRELQPLHPTRTSTSSSIVLQPPPFKNNNPNPDSGKHETTV